ncbi:hypothetical protein TNCV_2399701 [Trichonephila clavipes]|uniref:Mos1 transposase HTH domain-containing protein n=1 Tax=Trichonephila clavipes TaxID=2585209 RepID=A0A8X6SWN9_TRICX|nr:hypothetical protein TNCV_2399701 [Trichonephila clavipes]
MNSQDFRLLFLYELKNDHIAAVATRSLNAAFGDISVNECTNRRWYAKFESGDEHLTNEYMAGREQSWTTKSER